MNSSTLITVARKAENRGRRSMTAVLICFLTLTLLGSMAAKAQSTTTVQVGGSPNAAVPQVDSAYTIPRGAIVLSGTAASATGLPVRHLWVGDNILGFCRIDPDLDTPGPKAVNPLTCPFKLNGQSVTGGPIAYDPINKFVYLADVRRSQGIFRMRYDPTADGGNGNIDLLSVFGMAGNPSGARFHGGQTGCQLPQVQAIGSVALGPDGNLWATLAKGGSILRINNPATATDTGFGTCSDFVQVVASSPDGVTTGDLAWIGHDLWSVDGTSPFFISNADTTCQAMSPGMTPTCNATSALAAVGAATTTNSDQLFPQLNGNNLYFGLSAVAVAPTAPGRVFWVADAQGAQIVDPNFINPADVAAYLPPSFLAPFPFPLGAMSEVAVDYVDPGNLVVYSGDDSSNNGVTIPPTVVGSPTGIGDGRWWQTCLGTPPVVLPPFATNVIKVNNCPTPAATAVPGSPTVARAKATGANVSVSWSAAQSAQRVTNYRVRTFANAVFFSDSIVTPAGTPFPPTTTAINGLASGPGSPTYTFRVSAINGIGESGFSPLSNSIKLPETDAPGIPTTVSAIAGNASALVSWNPPAQTGGAPITAYTVTAIRQSIRTATTVTVAAPNTTAAISGLINGSNYSFSVHASNAGGSGLESTPSNLVTPTATVGAVSVSVAGPPIPDLQFLPAKITFNINVTNTTPNAISAGSVLATLTQALPDGAFIFFAQPTQGTCGNGGPGVLAVTCPLGTLAPLATATINVIVQIQAKTVTLNAGFSGTDINALPVAAFGTFTPAPPSPPPPATDIQLTGSAANGGPTVTGTLPAGAPDTYTWQIKNAQNITAPNVNFTSTMPGSLTFDSVTLNPAAIGTCSGPAVGSLGGTITCNIPSFGGPGNVGQFTVVVGVHVVQIGTIQNTGNVIYKGDTNTANNTSTVTIKSK
jgi:uncharacterized repeat protein (TIGR01451 family)